MGLVFFGAACSLSLTQSQERNTFEFGMYTTLNMDRESLERKDQMNII